MNIRAYLVTICLLVFRSTDKTKEFTKREGSRIKNWKSTDNTGRAHVIFRYCLGAVVQRAALILWITGVVLCLHPSNCQGDMSDSNLELNKLQDVLASRYHFQGEVAGAPLEDVQRILDHPPEIEDAVYDKYLGSGLGPKENPMKLEFGGTEYWRSAWGQNGMVLSFGKSAAEATNMIYRGTIKGTFGTTNWRGSDALPHYGGVVYSDGISEGENVFGTSRVNAQNATLPLNLGVFPLAIGSVRFMDATHFLAANTMDGKTNLHCALIVSDTHTVTGIAFQWQDPKAAGSIWIASFLKTSEDGHGNSGSLSSDIQFPVRKFSTYRIAPDYTNFILEILVTSIKLSKDTLPVDYFRPTNWISDQPLAQSIIISNAMYDRLGGKLVLASSIGRHPPGQYRIFIIVILALGMVLPLAIILRANRKSSASL